MLADFYNVQAEVPTFADDYTANKAKYATTPAAVRGFEHLEEAFKAGYFNEDFGAATYDDGAPDGRDRRGGALPDADLRDRRRSSRTTPRTSTTSASSPSPAPDAAKNGLTVWMPAGALHPGRRASTSRRPRTSSNFVASVEGCDVMTETIGATGPYWSRAASCRPTCRRRWPTCCPTSRPRAPPRPALEFLSPVKGPALEQITVEVGSGIRPAADGAALYDQDVEKQAKQLGLPGW